MIKISVDLAGQQKPKDLLRLWQIFKMQSEWYFSDITELEDAVLTLKKENRDLKGKV